MAPSSASTEQLFFEEMWRSERAINLFRAGVWLTIPVVVLAQTLAAGRETPPGVFLGAGYGLSLLLLGRTLLRRWFHPVLPAALSTLDVALLVIVMDVTHRNLIALGSAHAFQQLHAAVGGMMIIIGANALRFDWRITAWTTFCAATGYAGLVLMHRAAGPGPTTAVNIVQMVLLGVVLGYASRKLRTIVRRVKERDALARYLPGPVVDRLARDPGAIVLGGEEQTATVLFSDIRGFTTLSEDMPPAAIVALLNEYFREMVDEIFANQGTLDKFLGDGICAVFGPPAAEHDHAARAVRCALGMQRRLEGLNRDRVTRGEAPIEIGIGLHTGRLIAGNVGSPLRMEYTHIGDTVNTASRIEGLTKQVGAPILVSSATREQADLTDVTFDEVGPMSMKGKAKALALFRVEAA